MVANVTIGSAALGFPRMGAKRELKFALESYWSGKSTIDQLLSVASGLRASHWRLQVDSGLTSIPSNDFSMYDQVLDMAVLLDAIPQRYDALRKSFSSDSVQASLATTFAMARGYQGTVNNTTVDVPALEMKKWFAQNYHYIVPELDGASPVFTLNTAYNKPLLEYREAKELGIDTRPVLIGPLTFLFLSNINHQSALLVDEKTLTTVLDALLPVYVELLLSLKAAGASIIQIDEPALVLDLPTSAAALYTKAYQFIASKLNGGVKILLATYFEELRANMSLALSLPIDGLHVDLVSAPQQAQALIDSVSALQSSQLSILSLGLVDGRNIWKNNLAATVKQAQTVVSALRTSKPLTVLVASSCSLLHVPHSLELETKLDPTVKNWLSFATEKLHEITIVAAVLNDSVSVSDSHRAVLASNQQAIESRRTSTLIHDTNVKDRVTNVTADMLKRLSPFDGRIAQQQKQLNLPLFPTTTIGSFPQTNEVRSWRAALKKGTLSQEEYLSKVKEETKRCLQLQTEWGIDVLVDGEFDRVDMVEYFGTLMQGFIFTGFGWVQSYGSRCVKPPIIFGDVSRPNPMTVEMSVYAQSCTDRPVKAMLTGPITILQWSFVRDDQPRSVTAKQIALAVRDEVTDLEIAGMKVIQIDEPAIREGLPLQSSKRADYLQWSIDCFLLSSTGVKDSTQIHTHMCYSNFEDMLADIIRMDADVITIENARSDIKLLSHFTMSDDSKYPNHIGPGLYDIHSPRVPTLEELRARLALLEQYVDYRQLWVNPDCGLKTRGWKEVEAALKNLVQVAREAREQQRA